MKLSVICPVFNEEKYIGGCVDSILRQDFPKDQLEVLFVDGRSSDKTREILETYSAKYPFLKVLDNPKQITPVALNIAVKASSGDVILRLDAHAHYPDNYFSTLVEKLSALNADNVGGVLNTLPAADTPVCRAIAHAMSSSFGMGNSKCRVGIADTEAVDTVPYGCFRREIFDKVGLFDEELIRNQDDEFNARIINSGGKIYLLPEVQLDYFARESVSKTAKMFYQYGLFKPLVNKKLGKPATLRQFFPPLFVAGMILGLPLCFVSSILRSAYVLVLALYLILAFVFALKKTRRFPDFCIIPVIFFVIHASYGAGYWYGLYKTVFKKEFSAKSSR